MIGCQLNILLRSVARLQACILSLWPCDAFTDRNVSFCLIDYGPPLVANLLNLRAEMFAASPTLSHISQETDGKHFVFPQVRIKAEDLLQHEVEGWYPLRNIKGKTMRGGGELKLKVKLLDLIQNPVYARGINAQDPNSAAVEDAFFSEKSGNQVVMYQVSLHNSLQAYACWWCCCSMPCVTAIIWGPKGQCHLCLQLTGWPLQGMHSIVMIKKAYC